MRQRCYCPRAPGLSLKHRLQPKASSSLWPDRARGPGAHSAEGTGRLRGRQVQGHARDLLLQGEPAFCTGRGSYPCLPWNFLPPFSINMTFLPISWPLPMARPMEEAETPARLQSPRERPGWLEASLQQRGLRPSGVRHTSRSYSQNGRCHCPV